MSITDPLENLENPETILIIKPSSLGDVVHTLPAVSAVKRRFPEAKLHWVVNTEWAPLLAGNPDLESVIEFPRKQWTGWRDIGKARKWAHENLGSLKPDVTLDFQGLLRSGLLTKISRASLKVGFRQAREGARFFYDRAVDVEKWKETHAVDRYLKMVGAENHGEPAVFNLPAGEPVPDVEVTGSVLLHPFSRGKGKSLNFDEVAEFCEAIPETQVILVGAGIKWPENRQFPQNASNLLNQTSLAQLIWLMRQARFVVSADSGPMHLAAGITDKVLSIHTWTDPLMVGPYRQNAFIYRDRQIVSVNSVNSGDFPENRKAKNSFTNGERILPADEAGRIAKFALRQQKN